MAHAPPLLLCFANFRSCSTLFFIFMSMIISPSTLADVMLFVVLPLCTLGVLVVCITFFSHRCPVLLAWLVVVGLLSAPPLQRCVFYVFYVFLFLANIVLKSYTKVTMKLNWDIRLEIER